MKKYFIGVILLIGLQSCKTDNVEDYELKVLDEIFDDLIYKMGVTSWFIPPPPPSIIDLHGDTVEYQRNIDDYTKQIKKWGKDTTIVIAVIDTLFTCFNKDVERQEFTEHGYNEAYKAMTDSLITSRPLDLSKIRNRERIILKYHSEFHEGMKIWERENYDFFLSGVLGISRIYFDSSRQFALFYCSFMCGGRCGEGMIVYIRKINDKWTIEKMISMWVS